MKVDGQVKFVGGHTLGQVKMKLFEYEEAEEQGLLLKLPCKVGDTVYCFWTTLDENGEIKREIIEEKFELAMLFDVNWAVFLTKEEAEAKLKELENE